MKVNKRILTSLVIITVAALAFVSGTTSYFSDTETSKNNVLQAGAIDLKIDNESYYNGEPWAETSWQLDDLRDQLFFNFKDLKPGDWGEDTISAHVKNNDAWLCMDIEVTSTPENGRTEPEKEVDSTWGPDAGELQNFIKFVFWGDDGDNVLETDETPIVNNVPLQDVGTVALADSTANAWGFSPGTPVTGSDSFDDTVYIGKAWCFGDMVLAPVDQDFDQGINDPTFDPGITCDGASADNSSQTDAVFADVSFTAIQSRHNGSYKCEGCAGEEVEGWAESYSEWNQGTVKGGGSFKPGRSDPNSALGLPDDVFVSLGLGGSLVLELPGYITGDNVVAVEVTFNRERYPEEKADVYVSEDGNNWVLAGTAYNHSTDGRTVIDVTGTGLSKIEFVKVVDTTDASLHGNGADGFDLDAVGAVVCVEEPEPGIKPIGTDL